MNGNDNLTQLTEAYRDSCRRLDNLAYQVSQDNASALIVYEQCLIALQESKMEIDRCLRELKRADQEERDYYLRVTRQALQHFRELLQDAEIKLSDIRPIPPFLY